MDLRGERVIAGARIALAVASLFALLESTETLEELKQAAPIVAGCFSGYAIGVLLWLMAVRSLPAFAGPLLLSLDLIWFSSLIFVGGAGNNPYPILYVFILLSAGLRWGMRETLVCAGICSLFSVLFPLALARIPVTELPFGGSLPDLPTMTHFDLNAILMRTVALLVVGYLVGYLAEREKRVRRGLDEMAGTLASARVDNDLTEVVGRSLAGICELYRARSATALFYDSDEEELICCSVQTGSLTTRMSEVPPVEVSQWVNLDDPALIPRSVAGRLGSRHFHSTNFAYQGHLGWLFVVEPQIGRSESDSLQNVANQMGPVLEKMFLMRRLRVETIEEERNRIARDFHDGPLQSFYSFELYLEVLQHWIERDAKRATAELLSLREAARRQGQEMREFVRNMRPIDVEPTTLLTQIRALADDAQKAANFTITVLADSHRIRARRKLCRELLQITRESLNNIRKHSDAAHAVITIEQTTEWLTLTIDDDGRGFSFEGEYSLDELDRLRMGPISIKQRARSIGADLTLVSNPGNGSKIRVKVPLQAPGTGEPLSGDVAKVSGSSLAG